MGTGARVSIPVLMYHQVTARPHPGFREYSLHPSVFAAQIRWLARSGYTAVDFDDVLAHRSGVRPLPRKPIVITFDDGYAECVENVVPVLEAHAFTAVFYLVAGLMGGRSRWLRDEIGDEFPLIGWDMARSLLSRGFRCESHTISHPRLRNLSEAERREELRAAREVLEDGLGHVVAHLAYPYGSHDPGVRDLAVQVGYRTACTVKSGVAVTDDDPFQFRRLWVPTATPETLAGFLYRVRFGLGPKEWVERKWKHLKGRLRGR